MTHPLTCYAKMAHIEYVEKNIPVKKVVDAARGGLRDRHYQYTITSLRLDLESASAGKTWLLLPDGFRAEDFGKTYPLPSNRSDLQRLAAIPIPPGKHDSGCVYLRRALREWKRRAARRESSLLDFARREDAIQRDHNKLRQHIKEMKVEARNAVDEVREEAAKAVASLTDLFSLGRRGLDGQMRAHLDGIEWQGEKIDARAFRECFRMVTQTVKALGLPSSEQKNAQQSILEEAAAAMRDTQSILSEDDATDGDKTTH